MLAGLAAEQRFETRFIDIEEKTLAGECQCLLQLSTLPVSVCFGLGPDLVSHVVVLFIPFLVEARPIKQKVGYSLTSVAPTMTRMSRKLTR